MSPILGKMSSGSLFFLSISAARGAISFCAKLYTFSRNWGQRPRAKRAGARRRASDQRWRARIDREAEEATEVGSEIGGDGGRHPGWEDESGRRSGSRREVTHHRRRCVTSSPSPLPHAHLHSYPSLPTSSSPSLPPPHRPSAHDQLTSSCSGVKPATGALYDVNDLAATRGSAAARRGRAIAERSIVGRSWVAS